MQINWGGNGTQENGSKYQRWLPVSIAESKMGNNTPPVVTTNQQSSSDPYDLLTTSHVITESIIVASVVILSVCILVILCTHNRLYHNFFNQFLCSISTATLIFSLFVRPGTIHEEIRDAKLTQGYCGLYLVLLDVEWIVLPYTLLFMTIERILAIREPVHYAEKMTKPARMSILVCPWAFGIFFGIIRNFAMNEEIKDNNVPDHKNPNHLAQVGCYVVAERDIRNLQILLGEIVANILPIVAIAAANIAMLVSFCCRRQTTAQTDLDVPFVNGGSIVLVAVADVATVVILIDDAAKITSLGPWVVTHWLFSALEILILIMAITLQPDIRSAISRLCCCQDVRDEYRTLINVNTGTQTNSQSSNTAWSTNNNNNPAIDDV